VLPSISCHQFSAGQVLDVEDVVVVSDKLLLQKVVFPCKTFLTSDINRAEFKGNGSTTDFSINFRQNDDSSTFAQEMRVRLKNADRIMKIIFFIIKLITKL